MTDTPQETSVAPATAPPSPYAGLASKSGTLYVVRTAPDGTIHGLATCHLSAIADHLKNVPGSVVISATEAAKIVHGKPFALVNGVVTPSQEALAVVRDRRARQLRASCQSHILGGFTSMALGAAHGYPNTMADQANLQRTVVMSLLGIEGPLLCDDSYGVWAFAITPSTRSAWWLPTATPSSRRRASGLRAAFRHRQGRYGGGDPSDGLVKFASGAVALLRRQPPGATGRALELNP